MSEQTRLVLALVTLVFSLLSLAGALYAIVVMRQTLAILQARNELLSGNAFAREGKGVTTAAPTDRQ